jgi:hypothetical protein
VAALAQLSRHEFLAHHVPQLAQAGLPVLLPGGKRGAHRFILAAGHGAAKGKRRVVVAG